MKFLGITTVAAGLLGITSALPTKKSTAYPVCQNTDPFASVNGRHFNYNGTAAGPKYFAGTNTWYLSQIMTDVDVEWAFHRLKQSHLQVTRVWGFGDVNSDPGSDSVWFQLLNSTGATINYGANGLERLDAVVHYAENYGIKLVLPFVNYWSDLGGIPAYNSAFGSTITSWFNDTKSQDAYQAYIKVVVDRYKCSSAVFAWELANEPRCTDCGTATIYDWVKKTSAYVKSLDSEHMVTIGDEGWFAPSDDIGDGSYAYSGDVGVDFELNLGLKDIDYGTFHLYPDSWDYNETWGSTWIQEHNTIGAKVGKPVVLEEYGYGSDFNHTAVEIPWQTTVLKDTEVAMDQFWQASFAHSAVLRNEYDDNSIWGNTSEWTVLAVEHAAAMLAKAV